MAAVTRWLCLCTASALLLVAVSVGRAQAQDGRAQDGWAQAVVPAKSAIVRDLQRALRDHDRAWLAERIRYPLRYHGHVVAVIRNRGEFLRNYDSVVSDRLRTAILMQEPGRVFENWQGIMVGSGTHNMWLRESGEGDAVRYEIVTINDSRQH